MALSEEIKNYISAGVLERFLRYAQIHTTSDPASHSTPSTPQQWDLLRLLRDELVRLNLKDVELDQYGFVYATLPSTLARTCPTIGLLAHVDTSPDQPGNNVKPIVHQKWNGSPITFPDDPTLKLSTTESEELKHFIGDSIITASGLTLLGADDKAGVAEIMCALSVFQRYPSLPHGEIRICFTRDEEIGRGVANINLKKLPHYCYTMDGGFPGELEDECFDAWRVSIAFKGKGVHPGYAKGKMINAASACARFIAELPEAETPERTSGREGFYHITHLEGDHENATVEMIIRDFDLAKNKERIAKLERLARSFEQKTPGIVISFDKAHQYQNMREILQDFPEVTETAALAIQDTGLKVIRKAIRGGTDGSLLSRNGHPTPNIFAGGMLFHSRLEWVALSSLEKAVETIIHLARRWSEK